MKPKHIAIIPDGNRRWARKNNVSLEVGYDKGISKIKEILEWCKDEDIRILTMWGFSTDNAKRDPQEIEKLFDLFKKYLKKIIEEAEGRKEEKKKYDVRVRFFGHRNLFSEEIQKMMSYIENETKNNSTHHLNLMLGYGGKEEIVDAVNSIISKGIREVDESTIASHLYTKDIPDPDLIIRTGGEMRLSGFMCWQSAYSELYFSPKLWPDFTREDFNDALKEYSRRQRRFGR